MYVSIATMKIWTTYDHVVLWSVATMVLTVCSHILTQPETSQCNIVYDKKQASILTTGDKLFRMDSISTRQDTGTVKRAVSRKKIVSHSLGGIHARCHNDSAIVIETQMS